MQKRSSFIRIPAGWGPVRKSGSLLYDAMLPAFLVFLGLVTLGMVVFTAGILLHLIPYY